MKFLLYTGWIGLMQLVNFEKLSTLFKSLIRLLSRMMLNCFYLLLISGHWSQKINLGCWIMILIMLCKLLLQPHGGLLSVGSSGLQTTTSLPGGLSPYPPTPSPMPPLTPMTPMTAEQAGIVPQLQWVYDCVLLLSGKTKWLIDWLTDWLTAWLTYRSTN